MIFLSELDDSAQRLAFEFAPVGFLHLIDMCNILFLTAVKTHLCPVILIEIHLLCYIKIGIPNS